MLCCCFQFFFLEGPSLHELQTIRQNHLAPSYKTIYDEPLIIHNGKMQWLFDHTGRKYLDMFAGIVTVSVGHCHPHVTAAVEKQLRQLWHTTLIYLHPNIHTYARELVKKMPGDLKVKSPNKLRVALSRICIYWILILRTGRLLFKFGL